MLQLARSYRYYALLEAGYTPEQIITCPRGDPCWCERAAGAGQCYVKDCGLASHEFGCMCPNCWVSRR